jgi:tRNA (Thr-GGU) A37 N-methylase
MLVNEIHIIPIARVCNTRPAPIDDNWGGLVSEIRLNPALPEESLVGLDAFSHAEIIFQFHLVGEEQIIRAGATRAKIRAGRKWASLPSAAACVPTGSA